MNSASAITLAANADELFNRVGRNLLNYQRIERMLKFLILNTSWSGPASQLAAIRTAALEETSRNTLGQLVGRLSGDVLTSVPGNSADIAECCEAHISFRIEFEGADEWRDSLLRDLDAVVADRNRLAHHLGSDWVSTSEESTRKILAELDEQQRRLSPVAERLATLVRDVAAGLDSHRVFMTSPEGQRALELAWLQQSPVIRGMVELSVEALPEQGWVSLGTAGRVLREAHHLDRLWERYGYSSLKQAALASGLFEFRDIPTGKGARAEFRVSPSDSRQ
jgi:hypothetical protein